MWLSGRFSLTPGPGPVLGLALTLSLLSDVCAETTSSPETSSDVLRAKYDSILLSANVKEVKRGQHIQWSFLDHSHKISMVSHLVNISAPTLSSYYRHRCTYYTANGSLKLHRLQMSDTGIYQLSIEGYYAPSPRKLFTHSVFLDVIETLSTPLIVQNPVYVASSVQLSCIVRNGKSQKLLWKKGNVPIVNGSHYILTANNITLIINRVQKTDCGFYTCTVLNSVNRRNISHFLIVDGVQFLYKRILVASAIAVVSTTMSFGAIVFIIFFGLVRFKVEKAQSRLTIAFLLIETKCYICLMISSIMCILDTEYFIVYRILAGIVCVLMLVTTSYIVVMYLRPRDDNITSFLLSERDQYIVLGSGAFMIISSPLPIYEAYENVKRCTAAYGAIAAALTTAVMLYICLVGLCFVFAVKNMQTWTDGKRPSRLWTR